MKFSSGCFYNTLVSKSGQFPRDLHTAQSKNISKIFLCHSNDETGIGRLVPRQKVKQITQLDLRGVKFLMDRLKEKTVHIHGVPLVLETVSIKNERADVAVEVLKDKEVFQEGKYTYVPGR